MIILQNPLYSFLYLDKKEYSGFCCRDVNGDGSYKRAGHLFQDRYKSENVESDSYLLTVVRYVHQNPEKAGSTKAV